MPRNPLAEVFGYPVENQFDAATRHRSGRLCPYHNPSGLNCTKFSVADPLGVCSVYDVDEPVITCPVRFRQDFRIIQDAADFFFPHQKYVALTEVRLKDGAGGAAGNIDVVLATLNDQGRVADFGAVEVQAVYISGNVSQAFRAYMSDPASNASMSWPRRNYPSPDYLSSSRKRLAPQIMFKGSVLHAWRKRMVVVVQRAFFERLPPLPQTDRREAELAWMIYDLRREGGDGQFRLAHHGAQYTSYEAALASITTPSIGDVGSFVAYLEKRINRQRLSGAPDSTPLEPSVEPMDHHDALAGPANTRYGDAD